MLGNVVQSLGSDVSNRVIPILGVEEVPPAFGGKYKRKKLRLSYPTTK